MFSQDYVPSSPVRTPARLGKLMGQVEGRTFWVWHRSCISLMARGHRRALVELLGNPTVPRRASSSSGWGASTILGVLGFFGWGESGFGNYGIGGESGFWGVSPGWLPVANVVGVQSVFPPLTPSNLASIPTAPASIFEKANHLLPMSFKDAPK